MATCTAALPALPQGWKRDYFFYVNGYVKDMDYFEAMPFTVDAMPFHEMSGYPFTAAEHFPANREAVAYQLNWNDRVEPGNSRSSYQFHYQPRKAEPELPRRGLTDPGFHSGLPQRQSPESDELR